MTRYIVVGRTMHESARVLNYFLSLFGKIVTHYNSKTRTVQIGDCVFKFSCYELYERYDKLGSLNDVVIPAYVMERDLDIYRITLNKKKEETE